MKTPELELMLNNALAAVAKTHIGITEQGGDNRGQMVERFQKAVDGRAMSEAWCLAFVWHCIYQAQYLLQEIMMQTFAILPRTYPTEHVQTMWRKSPKIQRIYEPAPGALFIWGHYKFGKATGAGHLGIITQVLGNNEVKTVEGNTGKPNGEVIRDGDGVYEKVRNINYSYGSMRPTGMLSVW